VQSEEADQVTQYGKEEAETAKAEPSEDVDQHGSLGI